MITDELIQRINELARKKKSQGLTPEEQVEQQKLYRIYLDSVRTQLTTQLDAAGLKPKGHVCHDSCGCQHHHRPNGE
ncbi:MAG TPA: hypothetical protein DER60_11880 [Syntrophomonas sp.]|jgi:uncharacterized protein YnzC (UPF0291/DUF896 family)|nr:hypothetical protein [Syntrophomonas sp.]